MTNPSKYYLRKSEDRATTYLAGSDSLRSLLGEAKRLSSGATSGSYQVWRHVEGGEDEQVACAMSDRGIDG